MNAVVSWKRARVLLACSAAHILAMGSAKSQDVAPRDGVAASSEDIVVTAQKRSERLLETPQSVTALSSNDLSRLGARQFVDFATSVPGLQFTTTGAGTSQISMRGVTTGADVGSTVGIYVDDVPYGSSSAFANGARRALDAGLFDIDRVEVLRGPQGTLYGASSIGGVLKYVMNRPSLTGFSGTAEAGVSGTRDGGTGYDASAIVNLPIVNDKAAVRASGYYSRDGGFVDNVGNGQKNVDRGKVYGGRLDLLLAPTEDLTVRLTGFAQNIRRDGESYVDIGLDGTPVAGILDQDHPLEEPFRSDFRLVSGTITYDAGWATLTSITSYQTMKTHIATDGSAVYAPILALYYGVSDASAVAIDEYDRTKKFTQEVRLASAAGRKLEWQLGAFYTRENTLLHQVGQSYDTALDPIPVNILDARIPSLYKEYAFFGDITWHLTDRFDVTGGVRYAHNDQKFSQDNSGLLVAPAPQRTSGEGVTTWLANARYRFSRNVTAYARFATGYRPGGPNYLVLDPVTKEQAAPSTFRSDKLYSYEAGLKAETADHTFAVDAAGYYIDWKNIQLLTAVAGVSAYLNAGEAHIKGAELTLTARPTSGFVATGAFSYNDGYLPHGNADLGARKGERLPNTPHLTASVNVDYTLLEATLKPTLGASVRYASDQTVSFDGSAALRQYNIPDYVTVDLRGGFEVGPVDAQIYVHNLFDTRGQLSAQTVLSSLGGPAQVALLRPRTVGMRLTTRF
ncbi:TonB-dependent receptor [Sphingomonas oryzagri]